MISVSKGNSPHPCTDENRLRLLQEIDAGLSHFLDAEDEISVEEITALFSQLNDRMACIRQLDSPGSTSLTEEQRRLIRRILGQIDRAYKKAEQLSAGCRAGLHGVQQKKWICAQFATQTLKPGSLLDYSEKLQTLKKEK